jgi:hypothetical protein
VQMKTAVIGMSVAVATAFAGVACSSSSSPATGTPEDSGAQDVVVPDAGMTPVDSGSTLDSGVACNPGTTLYERLGGHDGIHAALVAIVGKELADPDIASYFFNQMKAPIPAGHPSPDQIEECFTVLLANVAGGPYSYPPDGGVTTDAGTFMCRDMMTIHQPLQISGGSFDKFISIAAATLAPTVCTSDLMAIGGALEGTRGAIVLPSLADAGAEMFPNLDGGSEQ